VVTRDHLFNVVGIYSIFLCIVLVGKSVMIIFLSFIHRWEISVNLISLKYPCLVSKVRAHDVSLILVTHECGNFELYVDMFRRASSQC
jgi:hypothetical protein